MNDSSATQGDAVLTDQKSMGVYENYWEALVEGQVTSPRRVRPDTFTWRRGSAQMVLRVNPKRHNVTLYSILVTGVTPSEGLYRHLLAFNLLQRREALGLALQKDGLCSIVLKYTLELELATPPVMQRHVFQIQEVADEMDTELAHRFGGKLRFDDWNTLNQQQVDDMIGDLFP